MDEALRRLERGDDPLAYATALRRAGDDVHARRVVEARVRAGDVGARETLDACWPLDPRVERVVAQARETRNRGAALAFTWLVGDEDPRVQPWLNELLQRFEHDRSPMDDTLAAVARLGPEDRRRRILDEAQEPDHVPLLTLSRVRPDAAEAAALLARASASESTTLLLAALWHGRAMAPSCAALLREHLASAHPIVAIEAALALGETPLAGRPIALLGRRARPAWAVDRCPAETRDPMTGAWTRAAFVDDPASPLMSDGPREVAMTDPVLILDLDRTLHMNDAHGFQSTDRALQDVTRLLQVHVGDRVARWAGDKWLVRLEPDLDPRDVAERLRAAVAATGVTVSIGIGRSETWVQAIVRAEAACHEAKAAGRNTVREVT